MALLFDTTIYIRAFRGGDAALLSTRWEQDVPVWLSAVVLEELYAGTTARTVASVARLERDFSAACRVVTPGTNDWVQTGKVLAGVGAKYGHEQIGRGRLTNDVLIATSAARAGITVLTANARDFTKIQEFCPVKWRLA